MVLGTTYMMLVQGRAKDLALALSCSVYSIGEGYGSDGCPIFHPDGKTRAVMRKLAFSSMVNAYKEADRLREELGSSPMESSGFKFVFPMGEDDRYIHREPAIRADVVEACAGRVLMDVRVTAGSPREYDYIASAVKEWLNRENGIEVRDERAF